jgi:Ni/Co efflux regulator RcnB
MRRLLIATLALLAVCAPAWAQPEHSNRVGKASVAPEVQDRAQAELRRQAQPQQAPQQQAPQQQGGGRFDRGGQQAQQQGDRNGRGSWQGNRDGAPATQATIQSAPTENRGDRNGRGNWQGNRDGVPATQATIQSAPTENRNDRGNWQDRRGQNNGRDFNRSDNRGRNNFGNNRGYSNPGYGGQRHDFSNFRDFHRSFNASRRFQAPYYRRPTGWYDHRWSFGEFLPTAFWARDYWLDDFAAYGLPPPPYGAVWVRVGNDALLVDEDSGEVITVEYSVFY